MIISEGGAKSPMAVTASLHRQKWACLMLSWIQMSSSTLAVPAVPAVLIRSHSTLLSSERTNKAGSHQVSLKTVVGLNGLISFVKLDRFG